MRISEVENYTVDDDMAARRVDNLVLSASSVATFQCKRKWFLKYLAKVKGPDSNTSIIGSTVHKVMQDFMNMPSAKMRTEPNLRTIATNISRIYSEEHDHSPGTAETFKEIVIGKSLNLFKIEEPKDIFVVATELEVSANIEGVTITGIIDRVSKYRNVLSVDDYKTGTWKKRYVEQPKRQIALYSAIMGAKGMDAPKKGNILFLGDKAKKYDFDISQKLVRSTIDLFKEVNEKIMGLGTDEQAYTPNVSNLCAYCPYATETLCLPGKIRKEEYESRL